MRDRRHLDLLLSMSAIEGQRDEYDIPIPATAIAAAMDGDATPRTVGRLSITLRRLGYVASAGRAHDGERWVSAYRLTDAGSAYMMRRIS